MSRNAEDALNVANSLPKSNVIGGKNHIGLGCNVTDSNSVNKSVSDIISTFGKIDILVNAADSLLVRLKDQEMDEIIKTNLYGTMYTCRAVLKGMVQKNKGSIINISSVIGMHGNIGQAAYSASKSGIIGFSKSIAKEYGRKGITVNVIAPGYIETDMTKDVPKEKVLPHITLGRFGNAEEIAKTALFLAESQYITGQIIVVDGGLSL